jgi:DNA-directed RNA polymerase sigma subunit (sigma70/sigma32)
MVGADQQKARDSVRRAQADFEREQKRLQGERAKSRARRRERFAHAQKAGLSLREIGEAADLHLTRVREILREG